MPSTNQYGLQRFVDAQDANNTVESACSELRRGLKTSHWMWFIFPQLAGLGQSAMSQRYAIENVEEAVAYFEHDVLGGRLLQCIDVLLDTKGRSAEQIFGTIDAMKLKSSMTLFAAACPQHEQFRQVLQEYFDGTLNKRTVELLHS